MSQELSRTENRILGALARLDDFLTNPLLQGHSGTIPETSRNMFNINQGTNDDGSQSNPHPESSLLTCDQQNRRDMSTGVQRESVDGCDSCFPQTKFAVDGNSSPYASNWRLWARGHNVDHLTGSATKTWPPGDPKAA